MEHTLQRRVTHKYRDGWSSMDEWDVLGTARVVRSYDERLAEDDEDDAGTVLLVEVKLNDGDPAVANADTVRRALEDTFAGSSCTHDWDCCGCVSTHARARLLDGTPAGAAGSSWLVVQTHYRNY